MIAEKKIFEIVTDGRTTEPSYKLTLCELTRHHSACMLNKRCLMILAQIYFSNHVHIRTCSSVLKKTFFLYLNDVRGFIIVTLIKSLCVYPSIPTCLPM